jgi:hypothetical protein
MKKDFDELSNLRDRLKNIKKILDDSKYTWVNYSSYIVESLEKNIEYSNYLSERIVCEMNYSEYLVEKVNKNE